MTTIINLTPHPIHVIGADGDTTTFPTSGTIARVSSTSIVIGDVNGIPLARTTFGSPVDMPDGAPNTMYIVSNLLRAAMPDRSDLLVPNDVVRDDSGNIIGCRNFAH